MSCLTLSTIVNDLNFECFNLIGHMKCGVVRFGGTFPLTPPEPWTSSQPQYSNLVHVYSKFKCLKILYSQNRDENVFLGLLQYYVMPFHVWKKKTHWVTETLPRNRQTELNGQNNSWIESPIYAHEEEWNYSKLEAWGWSIL